MIPVKTSQQLTNMYQRLRHTAETLDQTELDSNKTEDYVTLRFNQTGQVPGSEEPVTAQRVIHSHPQVVSKSEDVDPLINRSSSVKKFAISESQVAEVPGQGTFRAAVDFVDDGKTLRATESLTDLGDENFLDSVEQSYIIYKKSGKMRTLKPKATEFEI